MFNVSRRGWPVLATLALVLIQLPSLLRTAADPLQSDFVNYLVPARTLASGGDLASLYEAASFEQALSRAGLETLGSFVPHPPANALWLLPFVGLPPASAKLAWTGMLLAALLVTFVCLRRLAPDLDPWVTSVVLLGPTLAIRNGLAFGQPYLVLSALLGAGALAMHRGFPMGGAFLLGVGLPFKPYSAPVGVALLLEGRRRPRALAGFLLGAMAPTVALIALAGVEPMRVFSERVLPWMQRGDVQDPFSPVWGSATALANHLFRFERDLNPNPWADVPMLARLLGSSIPASIAVLGIAAARNAFGKDRGLDAVGAGIAFALAASPFAASYHLVLLTVPALALVERLRGAARLLSIAAWLVVGSPVFPILRAVAGGDWMLAYSRFVTIFGLALWIARPFLSRRDVTVSLACGVAIGVAALVWAPRTEAWESVPQARGYSMSRPYFCGDRLRWWSPSATGRRMESRGPGPDCDRGRLRGPVTARFADHSWNLYWSDGDGSGEPRRLTFSDANEFDPVLSPDGCSVVFASDQGRGLGSSALYRLDLSGINRDCGRAAPVATPRGSPRAVGPVAER